MTFGTLAGVKTAGRNFLFSFTTPYPASCPPSAPPPPTSAPSTSPSVAPSAAPSSTPTTVPSSTPSSLPSASPTASPTTSPTISCVEAAAAASALDIAASTVTNSNLGGFGPDVSGDETLVYSNVGTMADGTVLDFSVTAGSDYKAGNVNNNGLSGDFGIINLKSVKASSGLSSAFTFSLLDSATQLPVTVDGFTFSIYDFDMGTQSPYPSEFAIASGYGYYVLEASTTINVTTEADGRTRFSATAIGTGADNPTSTTGLTSLQLARSVTFYFASTSSFTMTLGATAAKFNSGRNFMFSFTSPFPVACAPPPYAPPPPTSAPSAAPSTSPSSAPSSQPSAAPSSALCRQLPATLSLR